MGFLRVIEVWPPAFPARGKMAVDELVDEFLSEVRGIADLADVLLVADLKSPAMVQVAPLEVAAMLQEVVRVAAAPVVVTRDQNARRFASTVVTAVSMGIDSLMVARGDDLQDFGVTNVRDFPRLADAVRLASSIRRKSGSGMKLFAPVDLESLQRGAAVARGRVAAGADALLAQPPTTDPGDAFDRHLGLIRRAKLADRVLMNVFPFRDARDVRRCESYFGWNLPEELLFAARGGQGALDELGRGVVKRIRKEGLPGVYLSTRGRPSIARKFLG